MEMLCCDLRAENERLDTQNRDLQVKTAGLEEKLREASDMECVGAHSYQNTELSDFESLYIQGRGTCIIIHVYMYNYIIQCLPCIITCMKI